MLCVKDRKVLKEKWKMLVHGPDESENGTRFRHGAGLADSPQGRGRERGSAMTITAPTATSSKNTVSAITAPTKKPRATRVNRRDNPLARQGEGGVAADYRR